MPGHRFRRRSPQSPEIHRSMQIRSAGSLHPRQDAASGSTCDILRETKCLRGAADDGDGYSPRGHSHGCADVPDHPTRCAGGQGCSRLPGFRGDRREWPAWVRPAGGRRLVHNRLPTNTYARRKSSAVTSACFRMAETVPSGKSPE